MKLAHSATIPCVSQMLSSAPNGSAGGGGGGGGGESQQENDSAGTGKTGPDGLNRSLSFDGRRQVWAKVEAHWARVTLDRDRFVPSTGQPVVKCDPQGEQPAFYQRIRSWLTNNPQTQTYQQSPVMTKVVFFYIFCPRPVHLFYQLDFVTYKWTERDRCYSAFIVQSLCYIFLLFLLDRLKMSGCWIVTTTGNRRLEHYT